MSCRVALLRLEKEGWLQLHPPLRKNGCGRLRFELSSASDPREPVQESVRALESLVFQRVEGAKRSSLWNELIQRYHYLGYRPLSGAQMRYLVWSGDGRLLAALGFGASAWQVKPRDQHIGWNHQQRALGLHRIVKNARVFIFPIGWPTVSRSGFWSLGLAGQAARSTHRVESPATRLGPASDRQQRAVLDFTLGQVLRAGLADLVRDP